MANDTTENTDNNITENTYIEPANIADIKQILQEKNLDTVPVIFRKWKDNGQIIALFPTIVSTLVAPYCESFMCIGGHGSADYSYMLLETLPATPDEYAHTKQVLENIYNYKLNVIKKRTNKMYTDFLASFYALRKEHRENTQPESQNFS